jgi:lipid-A-disaccharide synthase
MSEQPTPLLPFRLPPPAAGRPDLLVVAGEHSGDEHAARMVRGLLAIDPGLRVAALGGPALAAAGAQLLHDLTGTSVVGFVEVVRHFPFFRALHGEVLRWVGEFAPRAVCFVDYPGLNLRLAAAMRARGLSAKGGGSIRTLYYISPQIWAWKARRRFQMARDLDAMAVIFPFEPACYADTSLPVEFVGHPFVAPDYEPPVLWDPSGPVLLLPGSRRQAVARIFPVLLAGCRAYGERPAVVLHPSAEVAAELTRVLGGEQEGVSLAPVSGGPFRACAVLTSSGTMSMHCALAGIPGAIAYRANPLTYLMGRWLVRVRHLGIANLILDEPMYPEFIQGAARPEALAAELRACVEDPARRSRAKAQAAELRSRLGRPAGRAAPEWLHRQLASGGGAAGDAARVVP